MELEKEISRENRPDDPLVKELQLQVANAFMLYTNYKHYHWQTFGPMFRDLHLMWDEFAEDVLETVDEFAERVRMIGQDPVSNLREMHEAASISSAARQQSVRAMVEEADRNLLQIISEIRKAAKIAEEQDDPGSVDLLSKVVRTHEKHEWFLREILKKGDGLVV
jgi:starvation-inducible DNA-binding protein